MTADWTKAAAYVFAFLVLGGTFYALVIYPFVLDVDIKLWLTGAAGSAITFVFGDQVASRTAKQAQSSFDSGLTATPTSPQTVTVTPTPPSNGDMPIAGPIEGG